jgi:hypothetical protein
MYFVYTTNHPRFQLSQLSQNKSNKLIHNSFPNENPERGLLSVTVGEAHGRRYLSLFNPVVG